MKHLDPLNRDHRDLYTACVNQIQDNNNKNKLLNIAGQVVGSGVAYQNALSAGRPDTVAQMAMTNDEREQITRLYRDRLVNKNGVERNTYDQVRTLTAKCPFCGFGEVYEVDHYLPQNYFPELNVFPENLVPICHPCNHIKLNDRPEGQDRSLLHPYFDQLPQIRWLFANIVFQAAGPVIEYFVNLNGRFGARLRYHFEKLNLSNRMQLQSARILVELEARIDERLDALGPDGIRQHFLEEGERSFRLHGNILETAAYFAAAENDDYRSGRYRN